MKWSRRRLKCDDQIVKPASVESAALSWTVSVYLSAGGEREPTAKWNSWKHQTNPY